MARWIAEGEYEVLLFRSGDQLIGYAVWRADEHGTYLRHFFICRDQRRQGWGRAAMQLLCREVFPKDRPVNIDAAIGNTGRHRVLARDRLSGFQPRHGIEGRQRRSRSSDAHAAHSTFTSSSE